MVPQRLDPPLDAVDRVLEVRPDELTQADPSIDDLVCPRSADPLRRPNLGDEVPDQVDVLLCEGAPLHFPVKGVLSVFGLNVVEFEILNFWNLG